LEHLIEFTHLEEQDNIKVLCLQLPPLPLARGLSIQEVLWNIEGVRIVVRVVRPMTLLVLK
jgi:hypothetical protein